MLSDLCDRDDHGACFDNETDGCRCECHPTDCLAGVSSATTKQPSSGGARQAQDPADGLSPAVPVRAARATVPGRPAIPQAPHGMAGGETSPQPRVRAQAAGRPDPGTGEADPASGNRMPASPGRGRTRAPAPATLVAHLDRAADTGRVPGKIPAGGALDADGALPAGGALDADGALPAGGALDADGALPAGQAAIAAAMSEDRGPDSLDAHVRKMTADLGLLRYHTHDSRRSPRGYPDLTICGLGGVLFRELKTQRGKATREQQAWLDALTAAGQDADVWRPECLLSGRIARELAALAGLRAGAA